MNFLTGDDMNSVLAVKLRQALGLGMWVKLHLTGMHVEGKVSNRYSSFILSRWFYKHSSMHISQR